MLSNVSTISRSLFQISLCEYSSEMWISLVQHSSPWAIVIARGHATMSETFFVSPCHCHLVSSSLRGWHTSYGDCQPSEELTPWTPNCCSLSPQRWVSGTRLSASVKLHCPDQGGMASTWTTCNAFCSGIFDSATVFSYMKPGQGHRVPRSHPR